MPISIQVREAAINCLRDFYPIWKAQPRLDQRRVVTPTEPNSFSIRIEPYIGMETRHHLENAVEESRLAAELMDQISKFNPELIGFLSLPGSIRKVELSSLIFGWCEYLDRYHHVDELSSASASVIDKFADVVDGKSLTAHVITALGGLTFLDQTEGIQLEANLILRILNIEEIVEISTNDIYFEALHDTRSHAVSTCLDQVCTIPINFYECVGHELVTVPDTSAQANSLLEALHILKKGRAGHFLTTIAFSPSPIPIFESRTSWTANRQPYGSLELNSADTAELVALYKALRVCNRDQVRIAAGRLVDAENRISPVDALLDAVIGLEALLNPIDNGELSFRVALNYAYLADSNERRSRYDVLKKVQKIRNQVVHGGLNLQSQNANLIGEHAIVAKDCLRDVLKRFLFDTSLSSGRKLSADFWLDRILPPSHDEPFDQLGQSAA